MKKPLITILYFLFVTSLVQSQENHNNFNKHSLGFNYNTNASFRTLKENKNYYNDWGEIPLYPQEFKNNAFAYGFDVGLAYQFQPYKMIALEADLNYSSFAWFESKLKYTSQMNGEMMGKISFKHIRRYVSLPIKLTVFYLTKEKYRLFISTGISQNFGIKSIDIYNAKANRGFEDEFETTKSKTITTPNNLLYGLGTNTSFGIDYFLSNKLMLRFAPTFNYMFYSNETKNRENYYIVLPYSLGLNVGAYWRFGM